MCLYRPERLGFQAAIESLKGGWQSKVWGRFHHGSWEALQTQSDRYVAAHRTRSVSRRDGAPNRRSFPKFWELDLRIPLRGRIIFLRKTIEEGQPKMVRYPC